MENFERFDNRDSAEREEVLSIPVRAGRRTYFFDIKMARTNEYYLIITESKKRFNNDNGRVSYEKHKIFLYKEEFEKFSNALSDCLKFIETGEKPDMTPYLQENKEHYHTEVNFDDLGNNELI